MSDDTTRTIEVDGVKWKIRADGMLDSPPLSEQDSRSAWEVYRVMRAEFKARGIDPPADPLTMCVRVAYGAVLARHGGLERGDEPLQ